MPVVLILRHQAVSIFYSVIQISNETGFNQLSDGDSKKQQYIFFVSLWGINKQQQLQSGNRVTTDCCRCSDIADVHRSKWSNL